MVFLGIFPKEEQYTYQAVSSFSFWVHYPKI